MARRVDSRPYRLELRGGASSRRARVEHGEHRREQRHASPPALRRGQAPQPRIEGEQVAAQLVARTRPLVLRIEPQDLPEGVACRGPIAERQFRLAPPAMRLARIRLPAHDGGVEVSRLGRASQREEACGDVQQHTGVARRLPHDVEELGQRLVSQAVPKEVVGKLESGAQPVAGGLLRPVRNHGAAVREHGVIGTALAVGNPGQAEQGWPAGRVRSQSLVEVEGGLRETVRREL